MYCPSCGKQYEDGALFCTNCGAQVAVPSTAQAPQQTPQRMAAKPQSSGKGKPIAFIAAAAVVVAIVVAAVATGGFGMMGKSSGDSESVPAVGQSESASSVSEAADEPESDSPAVTESDPGSPAASASQQPTELDSDVAQGPSKPKTPQDYVSRAEEIAMATFTNAELGGGGMKWVGSDASSYISPNILGVDEDHLQRLGSKDYLVIAKSCELIENDGEARKYRIQVVYEQSLNADGTNVQANIAEVGIRLDGDGLATMLTVT